MTNDEEKMQEISQVLAELIDVATKLKEATTFSLDRQEIESLQSRQTTLVEKLLTLDQEIARLKVAPKSQKLEEKITKQLGEFQKLNTEFVDQLRGRISCIQFSD